MNSKFEARIEAIKLAVNVEGVTNENVIEISEKIAKFIVGDAELPEVYDNSAMMKEMFAKAFPAPSIPTSDEKVVTETAKKA